MSFVTGVVLIDAPASALNNSGGEEGPRADNTIAVKRIVVPGQGGGAYPYVSAQAFRFWLRTHLERNNKQWKAAPVSREVKIAYTDGHPIKWWDDDLFGYMRAESKKTEAKAAREADVTREELTATETEITRISPLRVGTFVSLAPVRLVDDYGTMVRHDGNPVPHEHQFYRATLRGSVSIDLTCAGTFFTGGRVGYRNLDRARAKAAKEMNLEQVTVHGQPAYRLPLETRAQRVATLVSALGDLHGGAKQTLHYTDVTPVAFIGAVLRGGNNPFYRVVKPGSGHEAALHEDAWHEFGRVYARDVLSPVYVGWTAGYADDQRAAIKALTDKLEGTTTLRFEIGHPREVIAKLATALVSPGAATWFD
jgi:CRISPR-associated protein Cst2